MVYAAVRHSGMCKAAYLTLARSRSTGFLVCIMIEPTPKRGMRLQYQPSNTWQAWSVILVIHSYKSMIFSHLKQQMSTPGFRADIFVHDLIQQYAYIWRI